MIIAMAIENNMTMDVASFQITTLLLGKPRETTMNRSGTSSTRPFSFDPAAMNNLNNKPKKLRDVGGKSETRIFVKHSKKILKPQISSNSEGPSLVVMSDHEARVSNKKAITKKRNVWE
jgi:hypothetical protein